VVLFAVIIAIIAVTRPRTENEEVTVGVIIPGSKDEYGWNGMSAQAIEKACDELGVGIEIKENTTEYTGKCEIAVNELIDDGIGIIIMPSYNYVEEIEQVIRNNPDTEFYCTAPKTDIPNYTAYFARMYQGRYLSGILAAMMSKTNNLGYVAAMNNNEVNRGINAFALGARSVNKDIVVNVAFTGDWDIEETEKKATNFLIDKCNADIITYHQNRNFVSDAAAAKGIDVIGYNLRQDEYTDNMIAAVTSDWTKIYRDIITSYMQKKPTGGGNYWIGLENKAVALEITSDKVTDEAELEIAEAQRRLIDGYEVFSGVIYDNNGNLRCGENEVISDDVLLQQMDWFAEGVKIYENID
jgi:basic membrane protein A